MGKLIKRKTAGFEPAAIVSTQSDIATQIIKGQYKNRWILEITTFSSDKESTVFIGGKIGQSLLFLYKKHDGLTRAESTIESYVVCLTQHVAEIRKIFGWDFVETERIGENRHACYHLIPPVSVRILLKGGQ